MQEISRKIAEYIGRQLDLEQERVHVLQFGLLAFLQIFLILGIVSAVSVLLDCWYESVVIFIAVGVLRRSTGGAHSDTFMGCVIFSTLQIILASFFIRYSLLPFALYSTMQSRLLTVLVLTALYGAVARVVYKLAPVDSAKRPITNPAKIARLRRGSFITLGVYYLLTAALTLFSGTRHRWISLGFSLFLASAWQTFTLTAAGHSFTQYMDGKFGAVGKGA